MRKVLLTPGRSNKASDYFLEIYRVVIGKLVRLPPSEMKNKDLTIGVMWDL